ncbi:MAG: thiolase family protein, partial [Chloroflexi bacterium]|nr:thiolase family protein [Chloroflexota bacterium]
AAFRMAGIELKDIHVAELYDCFTSEVLFQLEDYGWCKKGEGGPFAAAGNIGPGGTIPVNTGGGMLSSHHHSGFTPLAEAIIQVRGEGGARQVKGAEIALATGHGGEVLGPGMCSSHSCIILGR